MVPGVWEVILEARYVGMVLDHQGFKGTVAKNLSKRAKFDYHPKVPMGTLGEGRKVFSKGAGQLEFTSVSLGYDNLLGHHLTSNVDFD